MQNKDFVNVQPRKKLSGPAIVFLWLVVMVALSSLTGCAGKMSGESAARERAESAAKYDHVIAEQTARLAAREKRIGEETGRWNAENQRRSGYVDGRKAIDCNNPRNDSQTLVCMAGALDMDLTITH